MLRSDQVIRLLAVGTVKIDSYETQDFFAARDLVLARICYSADFDRRAGFDAMGISCEPMARGAVAGIVAPVRSV